MSVKFGVVVFPGSNCDHDAYHVVKKNLGQDADFLWHKENDLKNSDVIILPGGFSYGDYLRTGAIARFSPIVNSVIEFANKGGLVIGICNGFQVLAESNLLPGILLKNNSTKFICKDVYLKVENNATNFSNSIKESVIKVPIAHGDGNYFAENSVIEELESNNQIVFRYSDSKGNINDQFNPNGSINNIAGIINKNGNVLGMMPHPERCSSEILNNSDGIQVFESIVSSFVK
jgi:phosphoribosylformylglycinamidine synthase I